MCSKTCEGLADSQSLGLHKGCRVGEATLKQFTHVSGANIGEPSGRRWDSKFRMVTHLVTFILAPNAWLPTEKWWHTIKLSHLLSSDDNPTTYTHIYTNTDTHHIHNKCICTVVLGDFINTLNTINIQRIKGPKYAQE